MISINMNNSSKKQSVKKIIKYFLISLAGITGIFVIIGFLFFKKFPVIEQSVYQEVASPNNVYKAVEFSRDGGATTGFNTQISIIKAGKKLPDKPGNIYISDGRAFITFMWISDTELHIKICGEDFRSIKSETSYKGINIVYE